VTSKADPAVLLADRGYDSDAIRAEAVREAERPRSHKKSRRLQHSVNRAIYAMRNRIERFINRLKNSRLAASATIMPPAAFSASPC
jgi:DNA-binding transcriptional regulator PaaX